MRLLVMIRNNDQLSDDLVTQRGGVAIGWLSVSARAQRVTWVCEYCVVVEVVEPYEKLDTLDTDETGNNIISHPTPDNNQRRNGGLSTGRKHRLINHNDKNMHKSILSKSN